MSIGNTRTSATTGSKTSTASTASTTSTSVKGDGTLHYILLDGLTSSWREFLALHELGSRVKLGPEVLGSDPRECFSLVGTPEGKGDQDW